MGLSIAVCIGLLLLLPWSWLFIWWIGFSITTFFIYGFDKMQARRQQSRVPEKVLLSLVFAGGFIGGWGGMLIWRHKTRHQSFWILTTLATVLHLGLAWWLRP
ncbi:MAG: DUF1294 domain-containing protein [Chloroflexaceae bacterium]|nr:DUF1294 domain-containing protein [Chloroflexaceae bacterium]